MSANPQLTQMDHTRSHPPERVSFWLTSIVVWKQGRLMSSVQPLWQSWFPFDIEKSKTCCSFMAFVNHTWRTSETKSNFYSIGAQKVANLVKITDLDFGVIFLCCASNEKYAKTVQFHKLATLNGRHVGPWLHSFLACGYNDSIYLTHPKSWFIRHSLNTHLLEHNKVCGFITLILRAFTAWATNALEVAFRTLLIGSSWSHYNIIKLRSINRSITMHATFTRGTS